jgi:hypothetical protein
MIYKTVSSKVIISKIYRDLKPASSSWEADAIEWIGEALDFIGAFAGLEKRSVRLTVTDYRAVLPSNFYSMRGVYYEGTQLPYGGTLKHIGGLLDSDVYLAAKTEVLTTDNVTVTSYGSLRAQSGASEDYFLINPNYIQTSFETGEIRIAYNAFPVDDDGYPMVPDSIYYRTALFWYVLKMMLMGGYTHPIFTYEYADQQWKRYCASAQNDAMFPSIPKMMSLRDKWVSFYVEPNPLLDEHSELDLDEDPETVLE